MRIAVMALRIVLLLALGTSAAAESSAPAPCAVSPTSLNFGSLEIGSSRDLSFTITATGEGGIEGFVTEDCGHYRILSGEGGYFLYGGESMNVVVRFRPTAAGTHTCNIDLGTSDCPLVSCTGVGLDPAVCSINPLSLDFGDVIAGERDTLSFIITNIGGATMNGTVTEDCADYSILSGAFYSLGSGKSSVVTIEFAPTVTGSRNCEINPGPACGVVYCTGNGIAPPQCDVSTGSLDFGSVLVGDSDTLSFTIENAGALPFSGSVSAECGEYALVTGAGAYTLDPGMTRTVSVAFSPESIGTKACTISTGATYCTDVACTGIGDIAPVCSLYPQSLDFGVVSLGTEDTLFFSITNAGGGTLSGSVTESCADFTILSGGGSFALAAGESLHAAVRFRPLETGEAVCSIQTGSGCPEVSCVGQGEAPPECSLSVATLEFGEVWIDSSRTLSFTISNAGGGTLAGQITEACADFDILSGGGAYELTEGMSRLVEVEFIPESLGVHSCTIETGVDDCPVVECSGVGASELLCGLDPEALDFGLVTIGETDTLSFVISNQGGGLLSGNVGGGCGPFHIIEGSGSYELSESESRSVLVEFAPAEAGLQACDLELGAPACSTIHFSGTGDTPPVCSLQPDALDFGSVAIGESATSALVIANVGGGVLSGEVAQDCGESFQIVGGGGPYSLSTGESREVLVRFTPVSTGAATCPIETGSERCGTVSASGVGVTPAACSIAPAELDFGIIPIEETADTSFTIANTGGDTLRGTVDASCGPFEVLDQDLTYSLAAGESRTFTIRFGPSGQGDYSCFLSVGAACGDLALAGVSRPCIMRVVDPGAGTAWPHGTALPIQWEEAGCSPWVRIDLLDGGGWCAVIVDSTENDGGFAWTAEPCGAGAGTGYRIRITDLADTLFSYQGPEEPFSITPAPVLRFSADTVSVSYDPLGPEEIERPDALGLVVMNQGSAPLVVRAGTAFPWIEVEPDSVTLAPAESETLWVLADPRALRSGLHVGAVDLETNSPADPTASVRVEFDITEYAPGDVNGDHVVDAVDIATLIDHILELVPLRDAVLRLGLPDLNADSLVNVADVVRLARGIAGKSLVADGQHAPPGEGGGPFVTARSFESGEGVELVLEGFPRPRAVLLRLRVSHPVDPVSLEASPPGSSARVVLAREGNEIALLYYELSATPAKGNSREGACPLAFLSGENLEAAAISFLWGEAVSRERSLSAVNGRFQADPGDRGEERSLLSLVRPNPFTNETVISFAIQNPTLVSLDVFSVEGRRIRTLVRDRIGSGLHRVEWDGRDSAGRQVASGIYFLRIHAGDLRETRRIVLLR